MTIRRASASNVSTAKQWLCQNHSTCTESMTFSESLENLITVSSICPRKLNNILNPAVVRTRGSGPSYSRTVRRHSCGSVGYIGAERNEDHDFSSYLKGTPSASHQSKGSSKLDTKYKSIFENDNRFCEVNGLIMLVNEDDGSNLKSILNRHLKSCKSFLNRFDKQRHSSDEVLLHAKLQSLNFNELPDQRRHSNPETPPSSKKVPTTVRRFISICEKEISCEKELSMDDIISPLSSSCEKKAGKNYDTVLRKPISPDLSNRASLEKEELKNKEKSLRKSFSSYPRFFKPILVDRRKAKIFE